MDVDRRLTLFTRIGFATRGILYIVIATLIVRTGRAEDPGGALQFLGNASGRLLLGIMAAGLLAYGIWRSCDAALNIERHDPDAKGYAERAGAGLSGLVHLALAWQAVALIRGVRSSGDATQEGARTALALPGGTLLLMLGGVLLVGVGVIQLIKAAKGSYLLHLEPQIASQAWARWSGRVGYAARGVVFMISGFFIVDAGLEARASEAGGMAHALSWLSSPVDLLVAGGLFGFGLFSLIEARFRVLRDVPVTNMLRRAGS